MASLDEKLSEHGIRPRTYAEGSQKLTCPRCSSQRANKTDPCLSVKIDDRGATWQCHHCGWNGGLSGREPSDQHHRKAPPKPQKPSHCPLGVTADMIEWFAKRGISEEILRRNRIEMGRAWIAARQAEADCIVFPYLRRGEMVNAKYRTFDKEFAQQKGAEKILYGLDDLRDSSTAIIVEGEIDKLSMEAAGLHNAVSVPDGAPKQVKLGEPDPDDAKFSYLANCADRLDQMKRIILAVDADGPGRALAEELARRLGKERCWRVRWPDSGDVPCKDANEVLVAHGPEVLRECIEHAEPYPIAGLCEAAKFSDDTLSMFRDGRARGHSTGWGSLDEFYKIREGELTVVTGFPNSGKSEWLDALTVNLAHSSGWRFAVCSFENAPPDHVAKLVEKHIGKPFWEGTAARMAEAELRRGIDWCNEHFYFLRADDEAPTIDWILQVARAAVMRHGVRGLIIDPYNEIEHRRPTNMSETEYVSQALGKVKRFAQNHGVHIWFVAHPAKPMREAGGKLAAPTLYDISGSANWANKADFGVVVHRADPQTPRTEIHIRKVRSKAFGKLGVVDLRYDRNTGRYADDTTAGPCPRVPRR